MKVTYTDILSYSQHLLQVSNIDKTTMNLEEIKSFDEFLNLGIAMTKMDFDTDAEKCKESFKKAVTQ